MSSKLLSKVKYVMFMSYQLLDAETRYHTTERKAVAVLSAREECRWLILGGFHLMKIYTHTLGARLDLPHKKHPKMLTLIVDRFNEGQVLSILTETPQRDERRVLALDRERVRNLLAKGLSTGR